MVEEDDVEIKTDERGRLYANVEVEDETDMEEMKEASRMAMEKFIEKGHFPEDD